MFDPTQDHENRDDILHVPKLFEFFCQRTAEDFRKRSTDNESPTISFASLVLSFLLALAFTIFGKPQLAKATFAVFGLLAMWTVWGVVVRSNSRIGQKADDIRNSAFPPEAAPFILARLKWWNHQVSSSRWGRHSRLYDRHSKLERKVADLEKRIEAESGEGANNAQGAYNRPGDEEIAGLAEAIHSFAERKKYESELDEVKDPVQRLRGELLLYLALLHKLEEMSKKLDQIDKLAVVFHNFNSSDLSQVVHGAIQMLDDRRNLVLEVDRVDPNNFIDLITVRVEQ